MLTPSSNCVSLKIEVYVSDRKYNTIGLYAAQLLYILDFTDLQHDDAGS